MLVRLRCVKEGSRLRIKIITPSYEPEANCMFPKDIRKEGLEYIVPAEDVSLEDSRGKFFYRIRKNNIKIVQDITDTSGLENNCKDLKTFDIAECCICMASSSFIIFYPCGHCCSCAECSKLIDKCPLCRKDIRMRITKDQLQ